MDDDVLVVVQVVEGPIVQKGSGTQQFLTVTLASDLLRCKT